MEAMKGVNAGRDKQRPHGEAASAQQDREKYSISYVESQKKDTTPYQVSHAGGSATAQADYVDPHKA